MAMVPGSVSISALGVASGVGLAKEMFDDYLPKVAGIPAGPLGAVAKGQLADLFNSIAQKTIAHVLANATTVTPSGVAVATTGTAAAQTGATTAPGVGSIT